MNRIVLIGNGFDLAHGLKTSYADFIYWYWKRRITGLIDNILRKIREDGKIVNETVGNKSVWSLVKE